MDVCCSLKLMIFALALVAGVFSTSDFEGEKTTYRSCNEKYLCFSLKNESFKSSNIYTFNYTGVNCGTDNPLFGSWKPCHKEIVTSTIKCFDRNLILCNSKGLIYCKLQINVQINDTGRTTKIFSLSRWLSLDVKKSSVQVKKLNAIAKSATEVEVTWLRPECSNLEYSYRWSYTWSKSKKQFEETLADSPEALIKTHKKIFPSLHPFTKYRICIEPRVKYRNNFEPATCTDVKTLEAVPSRAPKIKKLTPVHASKTQWQCKVEWEPVETEYLNGDVKSTSIEFYEENAIEKLAVPRIAVSFEKSSHVVKGLSVYAGYFAKLSICNKAGCKSSEKRYVSINHQAEKNHHWVNIILISAGIVAFLVIIIAIVSEVIKKRRLRRTVSRSSLLPQVVVPRPEEINPQVSDEDEDDHQYAPVDLFQANPNQDVFENGAGGQIEAIEGKAGHTYELVSGELPPSMVTLNDDNDDVLNDDQLNIDALSFSDRVSFYSQPEDSESSTIRTYSFETDPLMPCGGYET